MNKIEVDKDKSVFIAFNVGEDFDPTVDNYIYIAKANSRLITAIMSDIFLNFKDYDPHNKKILRFFSDDIECFSAADEFWSRFQKDGTCTCDIDWEIYKLSAKSLFDFVFDDSETE